MPLFIHGLACLASRLAGEKKSEKEINKNVFVWQSEQLHTEYCTRNVACNTACLYT